jgi:hypothetical protein
VAELDKLEAQSRALGEANRHGLATRRFTEVLTEWLPGQCRAFQAEILAGGPHVRRAQMARLTWLLTVHAEVAEQIRQRLDPTLLPQLGDADALAEACYRPIVQFAQTCDLPLSTAHPVTRLSEVDLAIWTGFASTSIAPIFLPADFFSTVAWWPAVGHEIGHDFLISIEGLRDRIAAELELPSEARGASPLELDPETGQLDGSELWRVHGVWFEELFSDVFGTLMCGPAYGLTMAELFASKEDPREVLVVPPDPQTGVYRVHPPRHLRVHVCAWVLELAGFSSEARKLLGHWHQRNNLDAAQDVPLLFYTPQGYVHVPFSAVEPLTRQIVERLYRGPIGPLRGHGLVAISGLDYGPSLHAQAQRAKTSLLAGQVPGVREVRAVISGAVLAWMEKPELEAQILHRARAAISAVGTFERAPDAYAQAADGFAVAAAPSTGSAALPITPQTVSEALLLGELLHRPRHGRRAPPRARRAR